MLRVPQLAGPSCHRVVPSAIHGLLRDRKSRSIFQDLHKWGFQFAGKRAFTIITFILCRKWRNWRRPRGGADALLCTEKDVWNLRHVQFRGMPVYCCRISLELPGESFAQPLRTPLPQSKSSGAVKILVRAPNWVGDAVMAIPALEAVRRAHI